MIKILPASAFRPERSVVTDQFLSPLAPRGYALRLDVALTTAAPASHR